MKTVNITFCAAFYPEGIVYSSYSQHEKLWRKDSLWSWKAKQSFCQPRSTREVETGIQSLARGVGPCEQALFSVRVLKGPALGLLQTRTKTVLAKPEISFNAPIIFIESR